MSGYLINKNTGATRAGFTRCSGCSEFTRCTCPKPKPEKPAKERYKDEVREFDQRMAKSAKFVRGDKWK